MVVVIELLVVVFDLGVGFGVNMVQDGSSFVLQVVEMLKLEMFVLLQDIVVDLMLYVVKELCVELIMVFYVLCLLYVDLCEVMWQILEKLVQVDQNCVEIIFSFEELGKVWLIVMLGDIFSVVVYVENCDMFEFLCCYVDLFGCELCDVGMSGVLLYFGDLE